MSYNVGNGLAPPNKLVEFLRYDHADYIGLQELAEDQADAIRHELRDVFPYQILVPTGFSGKGLLSRTPLVEAGSVHFNPDRPDLSATVELHGEPVRLFVAHPRPPKVRPTRVVFDPTTQAQIDNVAEAAMRERPAIVLGDFNMTARQRQYRQIKTAGLIDAFQEAGGIGATFPKRLGQSHRLGSTADKIGLRPLIRIDYIWYTPELAASQAWVGTDAGSDHLPIHARLHWRTEGVE